MTKTPNGHEIQLVDGDDIEGDGDVLLGPGALLVRCKLPINNIIYIEG